MDEGASIGRRVAFFGGSFDPPHAGHVALARAARAALLLDTVLFVPVGAQPLKPEGSSASFEDRLAMTRLAIAGESGFSVSLLDAPKPLAGPNYTADSLVRLRAQIPVGGALFCLVGADSFLSLRHWHRAAEIPFLAALIVVSRPGLPLEDLSGALPAGLAVVPDPVGFQPAGEAVREAVELRSYRVSNFTGETAPLYVLPGLHLEISASQIRSAIGAAADDSAEEPSLLSPKVLEYIRAHGLYR